jgi:RNA polymerase sigma-70 factor, ECF subfamily
VVQSNDLVRALRAIDEQSVDPDVEALVRAARDGDRAAFEELVRLTYSHTFTLATRLTGNDDDARDVVQETYLRAWRSLHTFRGDARFSTWLYRITANTAYTHAKRRRRNRAEPLPDDAHEIGDEGTATPEASAESAALGERLAAAVAQLPPKLRAVVVLRDVYETPHEEIAEQLGISVTAAKVRLHRARKRLRDQLFDDERVERGERTGRA